MVEVNNNQNVESKPTVSVQGDEFAIFESRPSLPIFASDYGSKTDSYFDGKLLELMAYTSLRVFITVLSLGLLAPFGKCIYNKFIYSHTIINGKRLKFEGDPFDLYAHYFRWNFFRLITLGIYSFWIPVRYKEWELSHVHFEDEPLVDGDSYFFGTVGNYFLICLLVWFIRIISFGLLMPVAHVVSRKWFLNHSIINRKRVVYDGKGLNFLFKNIGWILLTVITLGIYGLWIPIKIIRWDTSNTRLMRRNELI